MLPLIFLSIHLLFAITIFFLVLSFITGAPFVPSTRMTANAMAKIAHLGPGKTVYDLGSGDGRLLMLAGSYGARAVGVEINPFLVLFTRLRAFFSPYRGRITVLWKDLWKTDLSAADVVFIYLLPWRMDELAAKLKRELKPGALVISNSFIFPDWKIAASDKAHHVYVFKI